MERGFGSGSRLGGFVGGGKKTLGRRVVIARPGIAQLGPV